MESPPTPNSVMPKLLGRPDVRRLTLIALIAEIGYAVLNISAMPVYLKYHRHMSESVIGLVLVAFLLSEAVFKGPMGHLADKFGRKRLIVIGPAISIFTSLATLALPTGEGVSEVIILIMLRAMDGVGAAMLWPAAFALMGDTVKEEQRQESMSLLNMCYLVGIALALPIGGIANDLFRSRAASLWLAGILFASVALTAYRVLPSGKSHRQKNSAITSGEPDMDLKDVVKSAKRIPSYLLLATVIFMGIGFPMAIIKLFAEEQYGLSESAFGLLALPAALAMAAFNVPMSRYGEKLGRARAVHFGIGLCAAGLSLIALGGFVPLLRSAVVLGAGALPVGIGFLIAIPAWYASVSELDPRRRAANIGAVMTAQGVGAIIGMPIGSMFYDKIGPYAPFVGCAACVIAGWLLSIRILHDPTPAT